MARLNCIDVAVLASGIIFGAGLGISQMSNPDKALDFLRLFGAWIANIVTRAKPTPLLADG